LLAKCTRRTEYGVDVSPTQTIERTVSLESRVARQEEARLSERWVALELGEDLREPVQHSSVAELPSGIEVATSAQVDREEASILPAKINGLTRNSQKLGDRFGGQGATLFCEHLVAPLDPAEPRLRQRVLLRQQPDDARLRESD
jgi:hypothetical protein